MTPLRGRVRFEVITPLRAGVCLQVVALSLYIILKQNKQTIYCLIVNEIGFFSGSNIEFEDTMLSNLIVVQVL
jgi:hypothetical protein